MSITKQQWVGERCVGIPGIRRADRAAKWKGTLRVELFRLRLVFFLRRRDPGAGSIEYTREPGNRIVIDVYSADTYN